MLRIICDLVFELMSLAGLVALGFTNKITFYQFLIGIMIFYGLQRFLSLTIDLEVSSEDIHE